ncbi:MAG: ribosomal RNA small subunit methyltransferase I [Candidatus Aenigmatarchaeota archaeon]
MKKFYIIGTPIGNLKDITLRTLEVFKEIEFLIGEDPLTTKKIFDRYEIPFKPHLKINERNFDKNKNNILNIFKKYNIVGYTSKAGTPGISDPGNKLVKFVKENFSDFKIIPIPGVSSLTTFLSITGENVNRFLFLGFLPRKKRKKFLELIKSSKLPVILFESPYRVNKTLNELKDLGKKKVILARELTKFYEEIFEIDLQNFDSNLKFRGEICLLVL